MMTAAEFNSLAAQSYGPRWQAAFSHDFGVAVRTVQRWAAVGIEKQATADNVRRFLSERRIVAVEPPPPGLSEDERDDACYDMIEAPLTALACAADDQGWHPAEVWVAILAIAADRLYQIGGRDATIETIQQAVDDIAVRPDRVNDPSIGELGQG